MDAFANARPFDLWPDVPPSLRAVLPNVMWDRERLHTLDLPVVELPIEVLRWQLDLPWWRAERTDPQFSLSPNQVRAEPQRFARHWQRTVDADLAFPIHVLERDRLVVLDGVHRLLSADVQGRDTISAHIVSLELFVVCVVDSGY